MIRELICISCPMGCHLKVDTDKLIEVDSDNGGIIKNGKVNIDDLREMYEQNGCNCKKEG